MAVYMYILTWGQILGFKSGMVIFDKKIFFHVFVSRKLFEPQKFPGSILSQIFVMKHNNIKKDDFVFRVEDVAELFLRRA